ncbi:hypothetical protein PIB30_026022 [Stylosanthes scabra]|uniref:Uncharacterized protein n=1 Tax=Stylosanthes scabra TaxID=79078 RepID=A0ABU6WDC2_9FABA|nr:hypothetical protein [Stylosanthes scabra]
MSADGDHGGLADRHGEELEALFIEVSKIPTGTAPNGDPNARNFPVGWDGDETEFSRGKREDPSGDPRPRP